MGEGERLFPVEEGKVLPQSLFLRRALHEEWLPGSHVFVALRQGSSNEILKWKKNTEGVKTAGRKEVSSPFSSWKGFSWSGLY